MNEGFLQFVWQQQLFGKENLQTIDGKKLKILSPGFLNSNAGPDFYNAKVRVGEQIWAGTIEVHIKSSDWIRHNHTDDKSYDNVILHVVSEADVEIKNSSGIKIPTFKLKYSSKLYNKYIQLVTNKGAIPCSDFLHEIDSFYIKTWQNRLLIERLERKTSLVIDLYNTNEKSWEETFYQFLAINFGFKINALPFDLLAKSLPYKVISKQKDDLLQIEALLFGQAGFLNDDFDEDKYFNLLKREYLFLEKKYSLKPIKKHLWKFLRLRPVNFPTIRIAQFAKLLHNNVNMFSLVVHNKRVEQIRDLFNVNVSEYWFTHYNFGKESKKSNKQFGTYSVNGILTNSVAVFLFAYGIVNNEEKYKEKSLELLESLPAEKNNIINKWNSTSVKTSNAFETQAMIELYNEYCKKGRCLDCNIGGKIIIKEKY